jgi:hypothetical protein
MLMNQIEYNKHIFLITTVLYFNYKLTINIVFSLLAFCALNPTLNIISTPSHTTNCR